MTEKTTEEKLQQALYELERLKIAQAKGKRRRIGMNKEEEYTYREFEVYQLQPLPPLVEDILEQMRKNFAHNMGVTLTGNRVTVRFRDRNTRHMATVHMAILNVSLLGRDAPYLDPEEEELMIQLRSPK